MITGRCECAAIRYSAGGDVNDFSHCHCSQCRRLHGAGIVSFAGVDEDRFEWTTDTATLRIYASSDQNDRHFCSRCGSQILVKSKEEPGVLYLAMGTIDGNPELPDGYHQFFESKVGWLDLCDDLPRYPEGYEE